jgi:hypothetical protein
MLTPPRDVGEAFGRLVPDLEEITDFIRNCPLTTRQRVQLANLLSDYFHELAVGCGPPDLRLVSDTKARPGSGEGPGIV